MARYQTYFFARSDLSLSKNEIAQFSEILAPLVLEWPECFPKGEEIEQVLGFFENQHSNQREYIVEKRREGQRTLPYTRVVEFSVDEIREALMGQTGKRRREAGDIVAAKVTPGHKSWDPPVELPNNTVIVVVGSFNFLMHNAAWFFEASSPPKPKGVPNFHMELARQIGELFPVSPRRKASVLRSAVCVSVEIGTSTKYLHYELRDLIHAILAAKQLTSSALARRLGLVTTKRN